MRPPWPLSGWTGGPDGPHRVSRSILYRIYGGVVPGDRAPEAH